MTTWYGSPRSVKFVNDNPSVKAWLDRLPAIESKHLYGQTLEQFCGAVGYSPEKVLDIRTDDKIDAYAVLKLRRPKSKNHDDNGFAVLDLLQNFLTSGTMQVIHGRINHPDVKPVTVKVSELSVKRRKVFYATVKSFFSHNRAALPDDPSFKLTEVSRTKEKIYLDLEDARKIITATKQPYHTLLEAALYGGMGIGEMVLLNELWPRIKKQLDQKKDPIRIDFSKRKTNPNPYFTLVPAKVFQEYADIEKTPFTHNRGKPVIKRDIEAVWNFSRKRVGIKKAVTPHMLRDLFRTLAYKCGVRDLTAEFLMGHIVDQNGYLQIQQEPDKVADEWNQLASYLTTGVSSEHEEKVRKLEDRLKQQDQTIALMNIAIHQLQEAGKKAT